MVWSSLVIGDCDQSNNSNPNAVITVVRAVVAAVMGCLFGCFKIKDVTVPNAPRNDSQSNRISQSTPTKEPLVSRNRSPLSSLLTEDKDETNTLGCEEGENQSSDRPIAQLDTNDLRNQAKFLKACGTLPETPAEIRNCSVKCKDLSAPMEKGEPLKFNSWPSDATFQKLISNSLPDQPTPIRTDGVNKQSGSLVHTPSSCLTDGQSDQSFSKNSIDGSGNSNTPIFIKVNANLALNDNTASAALPVTAPTSPYRYRSVHFESESDISSMSSKCISSETSQSSEQSESSGDYNASKYSPYPTPLKLTDEMQTPGTIFPAYLDHMGIAKTARIRSQFVYPVLNPVDNASQLNELLNEDSYSTQDSNSRLLSSHTTDSDQRPDEANLISDLGIYRFTETSVDKDSKPLSINQVQSKQHLGSVYGGENVHYGRTPGDRPIIGLVAAHWNDDETSRISPKWWDGNGIPNSTNKYKEDQKVSWHATPFEERLEKALSQETNIPQRTQLSETLPIALGETEQPDTAISQKH
ncbi:PREDICTED: protein JASON-like [Nicotiana attenuata]|uniref:Protein jason n=1 Tax=Nicotiana attenuata TaxID=49451 RepID=A0A1J6I7E2_NICAT|nr:PREDICTED: protein JASON-like [Nicotiana attenuata]OIS96455.1 protein jason [Nicotiana attenuata]